MSFCKANTARLQQEDLVHSTMVLCRCYGLVQAFETAIFMAVSMGATLDRDEQDGTSLWIV